MNNFNRYLVSLAIGFLGGTISVATVQGPKKTQDYVNGGLVGMAPALAALQMTLQAAPKKSKAKGTAAGE